MKVLFSLGAADIRETQTGIKSIIKALGLFKGIKTINYASKAFCRNHKRQGELS